MTFTRVNVVHISTYRGSIGSSAPFFCRCHRERALSAAGSTDVHPVETSAPSPKVPVDTLSSPVPANQPPGAQSTHKRRKGWSFTHPTPRLRGCQSACWRQWPACSRVEARLRLSVNCRSQLLPGPVLAQLSTSGGPAFPVDLWTQVQKCLSRVRSRP